MGIEELRQLVDQRIRTLGEDHPDTLQARKLLVSAYLETKDYVAAFRIREEILAGSVRVKGGDDRATAAALHDLAGVWFSGWLDEGRAELAIPLSELAVAECVRTVGPNDHLTLAARRDLAVAHFVGGQRRRAVAALERTLFDCVRQLGEDHPLTRRVYGDLEAVAGLRATFAATPAREQDDAAMAYEIAIAFARVLRLEPTVSGGRVSVPIRAIGETLSIPVHEVKRITKSFAPTGDPALEFVMMDDHGVRPLIVLPGNVVFGPEDPADVLWSPVPVKILDAQPLTSYAELAEQAERFALAALASVRPGAKDDTTLAGTCLLTRCAIAGAVRFGLRPLEAVAWWQQGWNARGAELDLPPFPPDPAWDYLVRLSAGVTPVSRTGGARTDQRAAVAALGLADFQALEPDLSFAQLDEEFVTVWKREMPITPQRFADLLAQGLSDARIDAGLYPNGAGTVDLTVRQEGKVQALLQLRFDRRASELDIDELRITEDARGKGLFQRLLYNTDQLARALSIRSVRGMATEVGSIAFATTGFPKDPELFDKVHNPPPAKRRYRPDRT